MYGRPGTLDRNKTTEASAVHGYVVGSRGSQRWHQPTAAQLSGAALTFGTERRRPAGLLGEPATVW